MKLREWVGGFHSLGQLSQIFPYRNFTICLSDIDIDIFLICLSNIDINTIYRLIDISYHISNTPTTDGTYFYGTDQGCTG